MRQREKSRVVLMPVVIQWDSNRIFQRRGRRRSVSVSVRVCVPLVRFVKNTSWISFSLPICQISLPPSSFFFCFFFLSSSSSSLLSLLYC